MSKLIFCLMGPTAAGKTDLACELIQHFPLEIISIDSAMIYRGMDIGTAKPDATILAKAPHHLIDILDPIDSYSASRCCDDVMLLCEAIWARGKIPLLVGGTMMYFRALQQGLSILPEANDATRQQLLEQVDAHGWDALYKTLQEVDPDSAARIHPHDTQRIQRAMEVYHLTGQSLSSLLLQRHKKQDIQFVNVILFPEDRAWLHQRIAFRFQVMLQQGLIDEVSVLCQKWPLTLNNPAMRCVGYRQVLSYLQNEYTRTELIDKGIAATRQLAKRQLTWLRHWPDGYRFDAENSANLGEMVALIKQILDNK